MQENSNYPDYPMSLKDSIKGILRPLYRQYLASMHKGSTVECNICQRRFKDLRPIVGRHADGSDFVFKDRIGACWLCNSYPRERQLFYWLTNDYSIGEAQQGLRVLHIAPELQIAERLNKLDNIEYTCIDKFCEGYKYPDYVQAGDILNLQFENSTFDLVICNHVLEHVFDDRKAIGEIIRVMKPNGIAILMAPIDYDLDVTIEETEDDNFTPEERELKFGQYDHVRRYGRDYFKRLSQSGLSVERVSYPDLATKYGFVPEEEIPVCRKAGRL